MSSHSGGWQVGQAIILVDYQMVVIHFGHDCAIIYLVAFTEVPDFNKMYDLYDLCTAMFFFRNKPIMIDLGTGYKFSCAMEDK